MCRMCDDPGFDNIAWLCETIAKSGWAVTGVEPDRSHPPFAYTVGLTVHEKPELLVTGMHLDRAQTLLNRVAVHVLHADPPEPGERIPLPGGPLLEVVEVEVPTAHLLDAVRLFGSDFRALQLVHADDRGCWPWEQGWRGVRGGQPVLGRRAGAALRREVSCGIPVPG